MPILLARACLSLAVPTFIIERTFVVVIGGGAQSGDILKTIKEHNKQINDIQTSVDLTMVITASKDNTAKVSAFPYTRTLMPHLYGCVDLFVPPLTSFSQVLNLFWALCLWSKSHAADSTVRLT